MPGDALTQKEIDKLLESLMGGGADEVSEPEQKSGADKPKYKLYDFANADKFNNDQKKSIHIIYEYFARVLSTYLTTLLRTVVEIEVENVEEQAYKEIYNVFDTPSILAILNVDPFYSKTIFYISPIIMYNIITRLFGGKSIIPDTGKDFSEIVRAVIGRIMKPMYRMLDEAWMKVAETKTSLQSLEFDPQFAQIISQKEKVAVVTMKLSMDGFDSLMHIVIPHMAIQPVAKKLSSINLNIVNTIPAHMRKDYEKPISKRLLDTKLTLYANFDEDVMSAMEIMNLQVGDYIKLSHKTDKLLTVNVEHIPKFKAAIGTSGKKMAVQIVDIIEHEEEEKINDE